MPAPPVAEDRAVPPRHLLSRTIKICLAIGLMGFGVTQYLSRNLDGLRSASLQRDAQFGLADPETTGSITSQADRVVLDPCAVDLRLR